MSWQDGVFRCEKLGVDDCVVLWDALAAVAASLGVIATFFLGGVTVYLAVKANKTAQDAMEASQRGVRNQEDATKAERNLILIRVQSEVASVAVVCDAIESSFTQSAFEEFVHHAEAREVAHALIEMLRLPVTKSLTPRLYNLAGKEAAYLARCLGICKTLRESWQGVEDTTDEEQLRELWTASITHLTILSHDLYEIRCAAATAVASSGITTPALTSKLGIDPEELARSAALR